MTTRRTVSVCMATFNGAEFLEIQVASILSQLTKDDELIVSDDGSDDDTLRILRSLADSRLKLYEGTHRGPSANFAAAFAAAKNDAIFLSDQDDVWEQGKLARQLPLLDHYPLVVSDCLVTDGDGKTIHESYFALNRSGPGAFRNFLRNSFLGCCMAFRRELLLKASPIPADVPHDWWLGMVAQLSGEVSFLPERLVRYRRHRRAASFAGGKSRRPLAVKVGQRIRLGTRLTAWGFKHWLK